MTSEMPDTAVTASEVATLRERVGGLDNVVEAIRKDIRDLAMKFDERSRMPWGTLIAAATFFWAVITSFVTIGGGVVAWGLAQQTGNITKSLDEFKITYESNRIIARQDNAAAAAASKAEIDSELARIDAALARSVPREEHQQIWDAQKERDMEQDRAREATLSEHQRQLDELKAANASLYGARDYFKDISEWRNRTDATLTEILRFMAREGNANGAGIR